MVGGSFEWPYTSCDWIAVEGFKHKIKGGNHPKSISVILTENTHCAYRTYVILTVLFFTFELG